MAFSNSQRFSNIALITIICGWIFTVMAMLAIGLSFWARRIIRLGLRCDDLVMITAFVISLALVAQTTWAIVDEGLGTRLKDVSEKERGAVIPHLMINETLWAVINTLIRVTALTFILGLFGRAKSIRCIVYILGIVCIFYGCAVVLDVFLICRPITAAWNTQISGACGDQIASYVLLEVLGLLIDIIILVIPLTMIQRLQMSWRNKIYLSCWLSVSILVVIITGLRIHALHLVNSVDFTYSHGYLGLLSLLGSLLGIIFCCVPQLAPLFQRSRRANPKAKDQEMAVIVSNNMVGRPVLSTAEATCQNPDDEIRIDVAEGGLDTAFKRQLQDPIILTDESVPRHTSDDIASDLDVGNPAPESRCPDPFALAGDLANEYLNAPTLLGLDKEEVGALDVDPPDTVVARDFI